MLILSRFGNPGTGQSPPVDQFPKIPIIRASSYLLLQSFSSSSLFFLLLFFNNSTFLLPRASTHSFQIYLRQSFPKYYPRQTITMQFLAALTVLATATVAVALPGFNMGQASCKAGGDHCTNLTIANAHGSTCCTPLVCDEGSFCRPRH